LSLAKLPNVVNVGDYCHDKAEKNACFERVVFLIGLHFAAVAFVFPKHRDSVFTFIEYGNDPHI
jgi:hypothetical protein